MYPGPGRRESHAPGGLEDARRAAADVGARGGPRGGLVRADLSGAAADLGAGRWLKPGGTPWRKAWKNEEKRKGTPETGSGISKKHETRAPETSFIHKSC